jgi:hypothetical protein
LAAGRGVFDQIVVPVIIDGRSLPSLSRLYQIPQVSISGRLRCALDVLTEHFEPALRIRRLATLI